MIPIEPVLDKYGVQYNEDRQGNQQVRCPFHDDKHASASVRLDEGLFFCFTCQVSGDAISIIMDQEGVGFVEAKRIAEGMAGEGDRPVRRRDDKGRSLLPRKSGHREGRRAWVSPWGSKRP